MTLHPSMIARNEAEARKHDAEAESHLAQARKTIAEADEAEIKATRSRIELDREQHKRDRELTADHLHHVYVFDKDVSEGSVKACISELMAWHRREPGCPIELQINSPGGSIFDGFALIDVLRDLSEKGHEITTVGVGMVASMAGVILEAGDRRIMGRHALLLIHEGSLGAMGDFGKVEDRLKMMGIMHTKILDLFASRANVSKAFIKRHWDRTDWWLTAEDCLKHGFIDAIR